MMSAFAIRERTVFPARVVRRSLAILGICLLAVSLSGCTDDQGWHATDLTGSSLPDLAFTMTRATDSKVVTAADYQGKVVMLYFGYTFCPDVCPITMANADELLRKLGKSAADVRLLFVTVDPERDTLPVLKEYTSAFGPQVDGLRGTPDQLASLARRYRVAYSVKPSDKPSDYVVTHSSAVYVFDRDGDIRLLFSDLHTGKPKIEQSAEDLQRLLDESGSTGPIAWLRSLV